MKKQFSINPFDYSDVTIKVLFCVADHDTTIEVLKKVDYVKSIKRIEDGISLEICVQQIPEIIRLLILENIAIYAVLPNIL